MFNENTASTNKQTQEEKLNRLNKEQSIYKAIKKLQIEVVKLEKRITQKKDKLVQLTNTIADTL